MLAIKVPRRPPPAHAHVQPSIAAMALSESAELIRASKVCQPTLFTNRVFTVYLITVSDHANHRWWTIRKRFSDFHRLRKGLQSMAAKPSGFQRDLRAMLLLPFPKKHFDIDMPEVVHERTVCFKLWTEQLMDLYLRASHDLLSTQSKTSGCDATVLTAVLRSFLMVPATDANQIVPNDRCAVCLCDVDECVSILPCGHAFHRDCVFGWVDEKRSCPTCRRQTHALKGLYLVPSTDNRDVVVA